ncbi:MerR family transcriptional regulator [Anaerotruncus rubiinfantis]|uniref:MerR family transcriptional regulator n=1 Tax=Anaerotruncus rubiinfantis TaxID=1720200 RepID=UPI001896C539|nr:MerR family transcriptional regulator [Anaerotruncus rubiinfantis]
MKEYLSITEMASLHQISRQTLIYYDRIGLFSPACTGENGYRCYSASQIPFLREICFLKSIGVKLAEIKRHMKNRDPADEIALLEGQEKALTREIEALSRTRVLIRERIAQYKSVCSAADERFIPAIRHLEERRIVFMPWPDNSADRKTLHLSVMKLWGVLAAYDIPPSQRFGSILKKDEFRSLDPLVGAGCYLEIPAGFDVPGQTRLLAAGDYACMNKYGMPYDTQGLTSLLCWISENGYEPVGDAVDACLLDTTFYKAERDVDFCQLQIPVKKTKGST